MTEPDAATRAMVRDKSDELAIRRGCSYDPEAGERPIRFIERFCRQSKGRDGNTPLRLLDWQKDFLRRLFGWRRPDGTRRYRSAYLEVAKKNGKSTMLSALVIYLLIADGEAGPEIYLNACDRDQASIIFDEMAKMVRASPELKARLGKSIVDSKKLLLSPQNNGVIRANSCEAPKQDGLNPSVVVFDELHRQPDRQLWDIFEHAGAARDQPLRISITTAGEDERGVWFEERSYSERVAAGTVEDFTHLGVVYRAGEADDIDDEATWKKANPSLGQTIKAEGFREILQRAKESPAKLAYFRRVRLNIIARSKPRFVEPARWKACGAAVDPDELAGRVCYGGLDLSQTRDLTAFVLAFPPDDEDGPYPVLARFWAPERGIWRDNPKVAPLYTAWAEAGFLELTDGEQVDYSEVEGRIAEDAARFELRLLLADRAFANQICTRLRDVHGIPTQFLPQTPLALNEPTLLLERLTLSGRIQHGGNPLLAYCVTNAVAKRTPTGLVVLAKPEGGGSIDGAAALVDALAGVAAADPGGGTATAEDVAMFF